jgi:hypothetical protein
MTTQAVRDYRRLVDDLAAAAKRRDDELSTAETSYVEGTRAVAADRATATEAATVAAARARAASAAVAETDRETTRIWGELRHTLGWRGRRLGAAPGPAPSTVDIAAGPVELLRRVADLLALSQRSGRPPVPRRVLPLLPALGAVIAALVTAVATGLLLLGATTTTVLGQVTLFLAPFAGLPVATEWADRRYGARLDTGAIGLTVIGGMVAACGFAVALR